MESDMDGVRALPGVGLLSVCVSCLARDSSRETFKSGYEYKPIHLRANTIIRDYLW